MRLPPNCPSRRRLRQASLFLPAERIRGVSMTRSKIYRRFFVSRRREVGRAEGGTNSVGGTRPLLYFCCVLPLRLSHRGRRINIKL